MKVAVVGCGVIGARRAENLPEECRLVATCDLDLGRAQALASKHDAMAYTKLETMLVEAKPDFCIIATLNRELTPLLQICIDHGVATLVEKPAARCASELKTIRNPNKVPVKVGFNHRYHPAWVELKRRLSENSEDPIMYIRARYGNGARVGFDKEWRANPELSGGGELLDQGVHVLDLALQLLPDLQVRSAMVRTLFWNMSVDDNAWALLETKDSQCFSMHVSSSEWKNEFQFDVYTRKNKYTWRGLGRSYGVETLTQYKMSDEMGPPEMEIKEYPGEDLSWAKELQDFCDCLKSGSPVEGSLRDAIAVLNLVEDVYATSKASSSEKHPVWLSE